MGWNASFVGKEQKRVWNAGPLCIFWPVWKIRNGIAFRNDVLSLQRVKYFFFHLLWLETKLSIVDGPSTLIQSID